MSWKEKRLITILSIILAVLCAAVLVVLSIRYRAAQAAKDQNTVSPSDIAETAMRRRTPWPASKVPPHMGRIMQRSTSS